MYALNDAQHLGLADCTGCHVAGNSVTAAQAGILTNTQETLCGGSCHQSAVPASHPSGFISGSTLPPDYPLTWERKFACSTCHYPHQLSSGSGALRGTRQRNDLCYSCHDLNFFTSMADGGNSLMVGHLSSKASINTLPLDLYSRQCMDCHAPTGELKIATGVDQNGVILHSLSSVNHTIGSSYQQSFNAGGYRSRQVLVMSIMLPSGALACVSCHFSYVKNHGKLALNNSQSRLCTECHDK
jgi:predicted CXXCH cytochrome family protein